jgi:hypothetical protein
MEVKHLLETNMTNTFTRLATGFLRAIFNKTSTINRGEFVTNSLVSTGIIGFHLLYTFNTVRKEEIRVVKKYKMTNYGFTDFMVVDDKGRHYRVNNSVWFWKWDSIEDWTSIQPDSTLHTQVYGVRLPALGVFPNIVYSDKGN